MSSESNRREEDGLSIRSPDVHRGATTWHRNRERCSVGRARTAPTERFANEKPSAEPQKAVLCSERILDLLPWFVRGAISKTMTEPFAHRRTMTSERRAES
mmetsp:Transcript_11928/g.28294  ORF Transcript_11928/g.28294 Transcript_11928/m.28294 type:complete len:101 (-) Transcript_11928:292-594(-)